MSFIILVVDDSAFARKVLVNSLKSIYSGKDFFISEAGNGEEALSSIIAEAPDFIFLDLTMPIMDGYQLLAELKKRNINIPTIVISADVQDDAVKKVKEMGVLGFLSKPLKKEGISKLLSEVNII